MKTHVKTWLLFGLLMGAVMLLIFHPIPQRGDSEIYAAIASHLLSGKGFTENGINPTAQVPPLYPMIIAGAMKLMNTHYVLLIHFVQFAMLGGVAALVFFLARRFLGVSRFWAGFAGALVLVWPYFLLYAALVLTEVPFTLLFIGAIAALFVFLEKKKWSALVLSGVLLGATLLMRPVVIFFPFWLVGAVLIRRGWRTRQHVLGCIILIALFFAMQLPWFIRNNQVLGSPLPTTNIGIVVWKGLTISDWKILQGGALEHAQTGESERNRRYLQAAADLIKNRPLEAITPLARKALLFWNPGAGGSYAVYAREARGFGTIALFLYRVGFFVILALGAIGLLFRRDRFAWILFAAILYFWILHSLLYPYPRYTLPLMPIVFLFAARALGGFLHSPRRAITAERVSGEVPRDLAISVVIPARDEAETIRNVLDDLLRTLPTVAARFEIIVIDDGSTDHTRETLSPFGDRVRVLTHSFPRGYGASIKHGVAAAQYPWVVCFDADGQHRVEDLRELLRALPGSELVIGARPQGGDAGWQRKWGKALIRIVVNFIVLADVPDFNSGLRFVRRDLFERYQHLYPNGFSLSTTSTVAFLQAGHEVRFVPTSSRPRTQGTSMVRWQDGLRTIYTAVRLMLLFAPTRVLFPLAGLLFVLFLGFVIYDLSVLNISNTSVALLMGSLILFFFGALTDLFTTFLREGALMRRDKL